MTERRSVVLVPSPFQGHITPMLQLATVLHTRGFYVVIAHTEYNAPDASINPEFVFLPMRGGLFDCDASFANIVNVVSAINMNCREHLQDHLVDLMAKPGVHGHISCVIYDSIMHFTVDVADHLNLPTILFRVSSCAHFEGLRTLLQLQADNYFPLPESQLLDLVPKISPLRFKDLAVAVNIEVPEPVVHSFEVTTNIGSSMAIIWHTVEHLEPSPLSRLQQHYQVPFFTIGPLHKITPSSRTSLLEEDTSCFSWLDIQERSSVLYVSIGSIATMDDEELIETAWALANSNQPFLWVVRPSSVDGTSQWIEKLPVGFEETIADRGRIVKWAPQKQVLAHAAVGGFWSHCGWNSTLESISEGVPMLCRPFFGDQLVNTRYITHVWKVGLELGPELTRDVLEKTIRRLMVDEERNELKQRAIDLREMLQMSLKDGGSSHYSLNRLAEFISSISLPNSQEMELTPENTNNVGIFDGGSLLGSK